MGSGGRVNNAIVTQREADEPAVVTRATPSANERPAFGVRFGATWYFDIHAFSNNGPNAAALLQQVSAFVTGRA